MNYKGIDDDYLPAMSNNLLQGYDNYQIYSLIWVEQPKITKSRNNRRVPIGYNFHLYGGLNAYYTEETTGFFGSTTYEFTTEQPIIDDAPYIGNLFSYQKYSIVEIPFDFYEVVKKISIKPSNLYNWVTLESTDIIDSLVDEYIYPMLPDPYLPPVDINSLTSNAAFFAPYVAGNPPYINSTDTLYIIGRGTSTRRVRTYTLAKDNYIRHSSAAEAPSILSLMHGYIHDPREKNTVPPTIIPTKSGSLTIGYYRQNREESVPRVNSLDWMFYDVDIFESIPVTLPLFDPVFGTVCLIGDFDITEDVIQQISLLPINPNIYNWIDYFYLFLDITIEHWTNIYNAIFLLLKPDANAILNYAFTEYSLDPVVKVISGNNNFWNNNNEVPTDLNINASDLERLAVSDNLAYNQHVKTQPDGSYGFLIMDSPRTIEIHKSLNAGKYAVNELDSTKQRVTDLGFLVERIAKVLGIRFDANGKIDIPKEKSIVRQVVPSKNKIDKKKIGVNCFGDEGIVVQRINNRFNNKDEIVSDQCVILQDIPQMIQEYFEQSNLALGLQESSAIEIKHGDTKARFNNQLELLVELVNLASSGNEMIRSALVSSLISQSQTNEIIAGIGLPSVTKTIPIKIDKKVHQLPYKGIAAHRSLSQEIATCTYNVGIATGQLL